MEIKNSLQIFIEAMENKLKENDHKISWEFLTDEFLLKKAEKNLNKVIEQTGRIGESSLNLEDLVDVANYCMMVFTKHHRIPKKI